MTVNYVRSGRFSFFCLVLDYSFVKAFDIAASIVGKLETSPHPQFMNRWIGCEDSTLSIVEGRVGSVTH